MLRCAHLVVWTWIVVTASLASADARLNFSTLYLRVESPPEDPLTITIQTSAQWTQFQEQFSVTGPIPAFDFRKETILAIFAGSQPSAGTVIRVQRITLTTGEKANVQVQIRHPRAVEFSAQVITHPYILIKVPRKLKAVEFLVK